MFVEGVCDVFWSRRIVRNTDGESCIFIIIKMSNNVFPAHCFQTKWFAKWIIHQRQHSFSSQDPYLVFMLLSRNQFTSQLIMNFSDWFAGIHHILIIFHPTIQPSLAFVKPQSFHSLCWQWQQCRGCWSKADCRSETVALLKRLSRW